MNALRMLWDAQPEGVPVSSLGASVVDRLVHRGLVRTTREGWPERRDGPEIAHLTVEGEAEARPLPGAPGRAQ